MQINDTNSATYSQSKAPEIILKQQIKTNKTATNLLNQTNKSSNLFNLNHIEQ